MNGNHSTAEIKVSERLSDSRLLAMQWKTINWKKAEQEVNRLQARIAKAVQRKKWNLAKRLQYLQVHSFYVKALTVRRQMEKGGDVQILKRVLSDMIRKRGKAWSQNVLIRRLNRQIQRMLKSCTFKEAGKAGAHLDYMLYEWLWSWAKRRHPGKGRRWVLEKYWHRRNGRRWVFSTGTRELIRIESYLKKSCPKEQ